VRAGATPKSFFGMNVNGPVTDGTVPLTAKWP